MVIFSSLHSVNPRDNKLIWFSDRNKFYNIYNEYHSIINFRLPTFLISITQHVAFYTDLLAFSCYKRPTIWIWRGHGTSGCCKAGTKASGGWRVMTRDAQLERWTTLWKAIYLLTASISSWATAQQRTLDW